MKTVINAKIIFETNEFNGLYYTVDGNDARVLTVHEIAEVLRSGEYELVEVLRNELMNDQEITLVIKHVVTNN